MKDAPARAESEIRRQAKATEKSIFPAGYKPAGKVRQMAAKGSMAGKQQQRVVGGCGRILNQQHEVNVAEEWYYSRDKRRHGPVTRAELGDLAALGDLRPRDLVWADGMTDWRPAQAVEGLLPLTAPPAPVATGETPPPVPSMDRSQVFLLASLVGLFLLAVSTFLPWGYLSGIGQREGKLLFLLTATAGAFLLAASLLKKHVPLSLLTGSTVGTLSVMLVIGEISQALRYRDGPGSGGSIFGLVVSLLFACGVCGWFSFLAGGQPVEWKSLRGRGLPPLLWRHGSLMAVQLVAFLCGLVYILD